MRILVAPDKFKGSLTAVEAADAMARGLRTACPEAEVQLLPIADGGEGTAAAEAGAEEAQTSATRCSAPVAPRRTVRRAERYVHLGEDLREARIVFHQPGQRDHRPGGLPLDQALREAATRLEERSAEAASTLATACTPPHA